MNFDLPANIEPQVQQFAHSQHISEDEAVIRLIRAGLAVQPIRGEGNVIKEGRGMFKSPEDAQLLDEAVEIALEDRRRPSRQKLA